MAKSEESTSTHPESHDYLVEAGFVLDSGMKSAEDEAAQAAELDRGGPYVVHGVYTRGAVSVKVEENTDTRVEDGMKSMTTYPVVAVISGPRGTVTAAASDAELVLRMAQEVS